MRRYVLIVPGRYERTAMQNNASRFAFIDNALAWLAAPVAAVLTALGIWLSGLRKAKPEILVLRAQQRHLDGETVDRAYDRIGELLEINTDLRLQLSQLQNVAQANEILVRWNRRMKAALVARGLPVPDKWDSGDWPVDRSLGP